MNKKTIIVLLPVGSYDRIEDVEKIEGNYLSSLLDLKFQFPNDDILIYTSHTNFMWDWNNQSFDSNKYWLTYVYIV